MIGRKNWLFANTSNGAKTSAIYYSLIESAKENGLNPFEYLSWVFTNAPNLGKPGYASDTEDLMPNSETLPEKLFIPQNNQKSQLAWDED